MKKHLIILSLILVTLVFITTTNFKFNSEGGNSVIHPADSSDLHKSHDVFNDFNTNLIIPTYTYYPPSSDNPLVYSNVNISNNSPAPQNEPSVKISRKNPNRVVAAWRDFRINYNPAY